MWDSLRMFCILRLEDARPNECQGFLDQHPVFVAFLAAEAFLVIARRSDIVKLLKSRSQRTEAEKLQVKRGLLCSVLLDALMFVPMSVAIFLLTFFRLIEHSLLRVHNDLVVWHAVAGITAFGFPFAAIKQFTIEVAKRTLREFGEIMAKTTAQADPDAGKTHEDDGTQE